jgi:3-deoxy-D-manno-octulosonic-acid transferase
MLYNVLVSVLIGLARFFALFNGKTRLFVSGRRGLLKKIKETFKENTKPVIWIHCSSLGEFEQGRPVVEALKPQFPNHKILITFFSPSGYEVRKNYAQADYIFYLPYDRPADARQFVTAVKPVLAIFIKYEFWPNLFRELKKQEVPILSVSAIFRNSQAIFKFYGSRLREALRAVDHFFVQNQISVDLLKGIGLTNVTVSGDTRFDRVYQITQGKQENLIARKFKSNQPCWVVGSCWPEDLEVLKHFINMNEDRLKFIIAPHEINETFIQDIMESVEVKAVRYSQGDADWEDASVLIVDNVGLLSQLYQYGEYAFVGGAFGKGLHNILEAACYGIPVFFGDKNYDRFQEAVDLIDQGGAFAVSDFVSLKSNYEKLAGDPQDYTVACNASRNYVEINLGATRKIISYCEKILRA